jgi:hypothetical protein
LLPLSSWHRALNQMLHTEDGVSRIFQNVSVFQTTRGGIPEDNVFHKHGSQNLKSHTNVS